MSADNFLKFSSRHLNQAWKPIIFDFNLRSDRSKVDKLFESCQIVNVVDEWGEQAKELFLVNHPSKIFDRSKNAKFGTGDNAKNGVWVYYPWRHSLVHCLPKKDFIKLKTSRNFNLISTVEQKTAAKLIIGIAGLNVGNPGAVCLGLTGVGSMIKLADIDDLSVSNLNRFRAGVCDLGVNKAVLTARQILEINPFASLEVFENGIELSKLDNFLLKPKLGVLVEEMDNLELKLAIRKRARHWRIPIVMVTGNGSDVIVDVERYDLDSKASVLNGFLDKRVEDEILKGVGSMHEKLQLARDFMGKAHLSDRLWESFSEVGKSLAGIPQLAESSFLRGAAICYFVRKIGGGEKIASGRYHLRLSNVN